MPKLKFSAPFGDVRKFVEFYKEPLSGSSWNIKIDGVDFGEIYERNGGYWYHDGYLYAEDVQAIVDVITELNDEPYCVAQFWLFGTVDPYWKRLDRL